jgi:Fe2+ transport system protein B
LPESIEAENVTSLLSEINEDSIEKHLNEQERLRHQAEKSEEENKKLREQLIETNRNANSNKSKMLNDKIKTLYKYRNELIDNKAKKEKQKNRLDLKAAKKYLVLKITIILFFLIYYSSLYYIILDIGWETSEKILTGLNILPVLLSVLYLLITEKTFNPIKILNQIKNKYILKTYNKYFFDIKEYEENIKKIEAIDEELKDLEQKN